MTPTLRGAVFVAAALAGCTDPQPAVDLGARDDLAMGSDLARVPDPSRQSFITLRSWRDYYPMDRGQARGQRVGNPWYAEASPQRNYTIGAQLTWRLPAAAGALSNAPNPSVPEQVSYSYAGHDYYASHPVEYYLNHWCMGNVFHPEQHDCVATPYSEIISEAPGPHGEPSLFLELWGNGGTDSYGVYLDVAACDDLPKDALKQLALRKPELWGLPAPGAGTFVAPPACGVNVRNFSLEDADILSHGKGYIAARVIEEGAASILVENLYYQEATQQGCAVHGPEGVALVRNDWGFPACLGAVEVYRMHKIGDNRLIGGIGSWSMVGWTDDQSVQPAADLDRDFAASTTQFSIDECTSTECHAL